MIISATLAASAVVITVSPAASALFQLLLPRTSATTTSQPVAVERVRVSLRAVADDGIFLPIRYSSLQSLRVKTSVPLYFFLLVRLFRLFLDLLFGFVGLVKYI